MYYPFFIVYLIAGLAVTLWAFWWALRNGQFKDQQRARFLPLDEEGEQPTVIVTRSNRYQAYLLLGLAGSGMLALAAAVVYIIISAG
ncbi:MAG: cbb3-type cytochrome oxidase assembly protein CcoS [Syntrophobacteria bacterium]|jgi:cbb3-type cytochrome oxidase maturation protein